MPLTPQALEAVLASVKRFLDEAAKEERPAGPISFPNREWRIYDSGIKTFIYKQPETAAALSAFRKKFETTAWLDKWSLRHLRDIEATIIAAAAARTPDDDLRKAIVDAVASLEGEPPAFTDVLPITLLYLGPYELTLGNVTLQTIDDARVADIRKTFNDIIDTVQNDDEEKTGFRKYVDDITDLLKNRACAFVAARGDADRAQADALRDVEPVVDFLQLVAAVFEPSFKDIRISVGGDLLTKQPARLLIAADKSFIQPRENMLFGHRLEMNAGRMQQMRDGGFGPLIDALSKPEAARTEFERYLIRSMHWIADAERQERLENRITGYVTAIDMFFATKGEPLTRDVTEGTAMLLGRELANRKNIMKRMAEFYEMRSGVSHAGTATFDEDAVTRLKYYAVNFLSTVCGKAAQFKTKDEFRAWMADRRLGAVDESTRKPPTAT